MRFEIDEEKDTLLFNIGRKKDSLGFTALSKVCQSVQAGWKKKHEMVMRLK